MGLFRAIGKLFGGGPARTTSPGGAPTGKPAKAPKRRWSDGYGPAKKPSPPPLARAALHVPGAAFAAPPAPHAPPTKETLKAGIQAEQPVAFAARAHPPRGGAAPAYAVVVPPGHDPDRATKVVSVEPPPGVPFEALLAALGEDGLPHRPGELLVLVEGAEVPNDAAVEASGGHPSEYALTWLSNSTALSLTDHRCLQLSGPRESWRAQLENSPGEAAPLDAPVVQWSGGWGRVPPTRNWDRGFPAAGGEALAPIPRDFQKQAEDRGTFFAGVMPPGSLTSGTRFGAFLPPGYDPDSPERYPVLVMLPGAHNPLHRWTSAGQLVPQLNRLMAGDAQKLLVMVADVGRTGKKDVEALVDYATRTLKGDAGRLGLAGISLGSGAALRFASEGPCQVASLSCHSSAAWEVPEEFSSRPLPAVYVDAGADEGDFACNAVDLADSLRGHGAAPELHVVASPDRKLTHRWSTWAALLPGWVAFHQQALGGKPGEAKQEAGLADFAGKLPARKPTAAGKDWLG